MDLPEYLVPEFDAVADQDAVVTGPNCRFTVLSPRCIRLEYDPAEAFEDRPSQLVWHRHHEVPSFTVDRSGDTIRIETENLALRYEPSEAGFSAETLTAEFADGTTWRYEDDQSDNLGGALRTVDAVDGAVPLERGLLSRKGWALLDDSERLVFDSDGWVSSRPHRSTVDQYLFGYGTDFQGALNDYAALTGDVPMIPRWALGNWWSRYWAYSQDELKELMQRFRSEGMPLSVCVIDMDWHIVENPYHGGWTGWTWNDEYYPDPGGFIDWLHEAGLRTTLNLHPAEGVHPHERQYEDFARSMGIDPASEEPIPFDAADPAFLTAYFEHLIHPLEDEGVDFWWIDWQQWSESPELSGLDPLWALNHLHSLDRTRDGRRPFILSRWPGLGGHRYPIGFSGDAMITWDSLQFQPHLTATSANVRYGWWSHDIGGHMGGTGDPEDFAELYVRWLQFGAFSPINRIHTTNTPSVDKRPWRFDAETERVLGETLRLRHRLIPYLYTMNWRDHAEHVPVIRPMYHGHPDTDAAYSCPHQYFFGSELLAAPYLHPRADDTNVARRSVWLPEGQWYDFFTGERFDGGGHVRHGGLDEVPVYAPAGAIVPLGPEVEWGGIDPPEQLELVVFPGADGEFTLYEDDGETLAYRDGAYATTSVSLEDDANRLALSVEPTQGDSSVVPDGREIVVAVRGVRPLQDIQVAVDGTPVAAEYDEETETISVNLGTVSVDAGATVALETGEPSLLAAGDRTDAHVERLLSHFEMPVTVKDRILAETWDWADLRWLPDYLSELTTEQRRAILETVTGAGYDIVSHDGDRRILVWNGDDREDVSFRYSAWHHAGAPHEHHGESATGTVPAFDAFGVPEETNAEIAVIYEGLGQTGSHLSDGS